LFLKPIKHNDRTLSPNFEFPVFEADEDDVEGIPDEISRLLEQEKKITQLHLENQQNSQLGHYQKKKERKKRKRRVQNQKKRNQSKSKEIQIKRKKKKERNKKNSTLKVPSWLMLNSIERKRSTAMCHGQSYQQRVKKHSTRRSSLVCSEKVTSCSRKSCLPCPIPGASESQAMKVHVLSREPFQAVL
jgi:hypothetical protein